ncbi:hypothetical protein [Crenobacter cavernae]|uniref:SseB protein N-terminal domain-containing protein n=1 Tax=Crenobacter cavernae TaxID=2290923 RepID=A0ABY0FEH3_9NEIS|nr:hypothetical protein [Crenobacter cavernae]RXZ43128.1 hypothetical protein EBB06_10935 [Crenobacter cavernae]
MDRERKVLELMGLYEGKLLAPDEYTRMLETLGSSRPGGRYALSLFVSPWMRTQLQQQAPLACRMTAYVSSDDQLLLVITAQVGTTQARAVMDPHDANVKSWLRQLESESMLPVVLSTPDFGFVHLADLEVGQGQQAPVFQLVEKHKALDDLQRLYGLAQTASAMLREKELHRIASLPLDEVTVNTIVPLLPNLPASLVPVQDGTRLH